MAQKQEPNVTNLFADLQRLGQNGDYERAIKVANKILHEVPKEEKAFHCKVVCLIQLGRFEDGLTTIRKNPDLSSNLSFEKAYCEYRLNRNQEATRTLDNSDPTDTRCQELKAQVLYRVEHYQESLDVYRKLIKNTQDDYEEERETNLSALLGALQIASSEEVEDLGLREDTYELSYNAACYQLGKGNYEEALQKLRHAEELCRSQYEEDADEEDDIDSELGVIRIQMGYALQKLGRVDEATKLYNMVSKQRPSDIALNAVVSNNIITINKDQNVFDSKKKIKSATMDSLQQKLTSTQKQTISMNQCLLYMYSNQSELCVRTALALQKTYPDTNTPTLIGAAQYCRDKQVDKAVEALKKQIDNTKGSAFSMKLTLAQLYLTQGHVYDACNVLKSLGEYSYKPGVVSAMVTLYMSQEDKESAADVLAEAIKWFNSNQPGSSELELLIRASANFHLSSGSPEVATEMLEQLRKRDPNDIKTLAQLISAYSKFNPVKAQAVSRELPAPGNLSQEVDVDSLEASVNVLGSKSKKPTPLSPKGGDDLLVTRKKHKKKKVRLPKNYDPKAPIDSERWLPLRERSYYRGKRHKRRDVGKGTQGAASGNPDLDMAAVAGPVTPGSPPSSASSPGGQPTASPSVTLPNPASKAKPAPNKGKKKKKGGKW